MKRATILGAVVASMTAATSAQAEEHIIMILPDAYFPAITYLDPGDTIRFVNISGKTQHVRATDGGWSVGPIQNENEDTLLFDASLDKNFENNGNSDESDGDGIELAGEVSFDPAPLN